MSDVDRYIMRFCPEIQARLTAIRQTALKVFGDIEERLYHGVPSLFQNGRNFMNYAAYKDHISICVGYDWVDFLKKQYPQLKYTKATVTFQHSNPFPDEMVHAICALLRQGQTGSTQ